MQKPPFKLAAAIKLAMPGPGPSTDIEAADETAADEAPSHGRARLAQLDPHLHCSVIGTCLSTSDLRKLMARFLFVRDANDLEVHHEAVSMASRGGHVARAIHKALDKRHEPVVQRFSKAHDAGALGKLWDDALAQGEVPGAYWAVLTHRDATPDLRQRVFGEVHMLSHLVGAANRADIRRLVALERDNAELRERADRQQARMQEAFDEHQRTVERLGQALTDVRRSAATAPQMPLDASSQALTDDLAAATAMVALQTERRERAEQAAATALDESTRLRNELEHLAAQSRALARELAAAETQLREMGDGSDSPNRSLELRLRGRRIFYVGGRPSSTPAIRDLVVRHGGEFQRHDGGLEDRKGLLASGVGWAELVVFPVDCIDHDSAGNLKRLCAQQHVDYLPLRSASVASFAAALSNPGGDAGDEPDNPMPPICLRHG